MLRSASHVVMRLVKKYPQYKIVNFDRLDYCASLKNIESIADEPNYEFVKGDIGSADLVRYVLHKEGIDTIMHFAAQTHVDNSFGNSFSFTECNVLGTHVMLEAAKSLGSQLKVFIHVSTDEVYGEGATGAKSHETKTILEPTNPYAATKAGAEYLVKAYQRSFHLPVIITRGNNVYGPHQYPEKIIPKFINQLFRDRKLTLHGDGSNTRNYLYVGDVAAAFDVVLHKGTVGETYNIGGRNELSNLVVAETLLGLMGKVDECGGDREKAKEEWIVTVEDRLFNDLRYPLETDRLAKLGWVEEVSWEEGLRRTVEWYRDNSGNWGDIESALVAHPRRGLVPSEGMPKLVKDAPVEAALAKVSGGVGGAATGCAASGDGKGS